MFVTIRLKRLVDLALITSPGYRRRAGLRSRTLLVMSILLVCLIVTLSSYAGEAFAQGAKDADFVKRVVSNVNAYWDKKFQLLGVSYTPARLVLIYNKPHYTACGPASTKIGPSYCPYNHTLYYPLHWLDDGRTLSNYGASAEEWAVAHEIGHNVQVQMDGLGIQRLDAIPLGLAELQADCFSGMYANQAITRPEGIKAVLAAMQDAGSSTHGTSEQRIAAFELGYETGELSECLALASSGNNL